MLFDNFLNKKINIIQLKSDSNLIKKQKTTVIGVGLRGINSNSQLIASKDVLGMVEKVSHLVKVSVV